MEQCFRCSFNFDHCLNIFKCLLLTTYIILFHEVISCQKQLNSYYCKSKTFPKFFLSDFKTLSLKKKIYRFVFSILKSIKNAKYGKLQN